MKIKSITAPPHFPYKGLVAAYLGEESFSKIEWIEIAPMPGAPSELVIIKLGEEGGDAYPGELASVLSALGWESDVEHEGPHLNLIAAQRRMYELIQGDARAELARYERAFTRWLRESGE